MPKPIVAAAIRVNGHLYTGLSHEEAANKALDAGEKQRDIEKAYDIVKGERRDFSQGFNEKKFSTGFMTKDGRYVDRATALRLTNYEMAEDIQTITTKAASQALASSSGTWSSAI